MYCTYSSQEQEDGRRSNPLLSLNVLCNAKWLSCTDDVTLAGEVFYLQSMPECYLFMVIAAFLPSVDVPDIAHNATQKEYINSSKSSFHQYQTHIHTTPPLPSQSQCSSKLFSSLPLLLWLLLSLATPRLTLSQTPRSTP